MAEIRAALLLAAEPRAARHAGRPPALNISRPTGIDAWAPTAGRPGMALPRRVSR
jgi:hypothetical protein